MPSPIRLEWVEPSSLHENPRNWRTHPDVQVKALSEAIEKVGWVAPLLYNERTAHLIDGHARRNLGSERVPVLIGSWSEEEEAYILTTLDPIAAMATSDTALLGDLLKEVGAMAGDGVRVLLEELARQNKLPIFETGGKTNPDVVPEPPDVPITQPGDLWQLGDHRILCGDSLNADDLAYLMAGEKASLLATDPPYLVDYDGGERATTKGNRGNTAKHWDDYHDPEQSVEFFAGYLRAAMPHLKDRTAFYQWHATIRQHLVMAAWRDVGLLLHQTIIWVKPRAVLTRSHYMWQHEPCFYGWIEGRMPKAPPASSKTVWEIAGENDNIHPTQKPVEIFARPIEYHTIVGDICLEPFSGSGTQIIAAERLGRRCFAMEQSPAFVDVAVKRWSDFTGREAVRVPAANLTPAIA